MIGEAVVSGLVFAAALTMPSRPPFPPSRSSTMSRSEMLSGLRRLCRLRTFWVLAVCYGALTGFFGAWGARSGFKPTSPLYAGSW